MLDFGAHFLICNVFIALSVVVIAVSKRLLGKYISARTQYNLWSLLLLLLAVPFLPAGTYRFLRLSPWLGLPHKIQTLTTAPDAADTTFTEHGSGIDMINDFAVSISSKTPSSVNILFLTLWGVGISVMLLLTLRSWKRLRALERSALPLQDPKVKELFSACLSEMGIQKAIPLYSTAFLRSPIIVGPLCPRIYIPIHLICDFDQKDMRFMLLHELQHYRYKDILAGGLMDLAGILYWFNPFVWYALKEMRCDREIACDSSVLHMLPGTDRKAYGHTLISFAEKISMSPFPFAMGISGSMRQMKRRILHIADFKKETLSEKMRGIIVYISIAFLLSECTPILSIYASGEGTYHFDDNGQEISYIDLSKDFEGYDGSFVLYDATAASWSIYNMEAATKRITPNSTYKIYDALLGLESGVITADHSEMAWDGEEYPYDTWKADQDLNSAMKDSVNWYFQKIDSQVGLRFVQTFLKKIRYGNQMTGTEPGSYWTDLSLTISPIEQVEMLEKFHDNRFEFAQQNINAVKDAICLASTDDGSFYGKTGTGCVDESDVNGWFIGYVERSGNVYYFATNIQNTSKATGKKAMEITASVLSDLQIWD